MANVNPVNGITYGFRLIGYLIAVFIAGFVITVLGVVIAEGGDSGAIVIGGLVVMIGVLTIFAGFLGMQYKIIADAVEKGVVASNSGTTGTAGQPQQQRQAQNRSRGGQQSRTAQQQQQGRRRESGRQRGGR